MIANIGFINITTLTNTNNLLLNIVCIDLFTNPDLQTIGAAVALLGRHVLERMNRADNEMEYLFNETGTSDFITWVQGLADHSEHSLLPNLSQIVIG